MCEKTAVAPLLKAIAQPKHVSSGREMKTNKFSTFISEKLVVPNSWPSVHIVH
jgi:hypothetical protein